jgi:transcription initiation factor IIE alpha subunit
MDLDQNEKLEMLQDAQEKMFEIIETLEVVFPDDANVKAYMIDHLKIKASEGHGFLSSDLNFDNLMERVKEDEEEDVPWDAFKCPECGAALEDDGRKDWLWCPECSEHYRTPRKKW